MIEETRRAGLKGYGVIVKERTDLPLTRPCDPQVKMDKKIKTRLKTIPIVGKVVPDKKLGNKVIFNPKGLKLIKQISRRNNAKDKL